MFHNRFTKLPTTRRSRNLKRQAPHPRDDLADGWLCVVFSAPQPSTLDPQPFLVQVRQIHRHPFRDQGREEFEERLDGTRRVGQGGSREMRSVAENLINHFGAGRTGSNLDEDPHAVGIRLLDDARKIDRAHGLSDDGLGSRFAREVVLAAPRGAVEVDG